MSEHWANQGFVSGNYGESRAIVTTSEEVSFHRSEMSPNAEKLFLPEVSLWLKNEDIATAMNSKRKLRCIADECINKGLSKDKWLDIATNLVKEFAKGDEERLFELAFTYIRQGMNISDLKSKFVRMGLTNESEIDLGLKIYNHFGIGDSDSALLKSICNHYSRPGSGKLLIGKMVTAHPLASRVAFSCCEFRNAASSKADRQ